MGAIKTHVQGECMTISPLRFVSASLLLLVVSGCASHRPVARGDRVQVTYACRLPDGSLFSTNSPELASDPSVVRAPVFLTPKDMSPLVLTAGEPPYRERVIELKMGGMDRFVGPRTLEEHLADEFAVSAIGLETGRDHPVRIDLPADPAGKPFPMARVRRRPKETRMKIDEYKMRFRKDPEVGQSATIDPAVPGKVEAVEGEEVVIRYHAEPGSTVSTPLGPAVVRDAGDRYELDIQAKPGDLVPAGGMIARVVSTDEQSIYIDYSHPIGGEPLLCDLVVTPAPLPDAAGKDRKKELKTP